MNVSIPAFLLLFLPALFLSVCGDEPPLGEGHVVATILGKPVTALELGIELGKDGEVIFPDDSSSSCAAPSPVEKLYQRVRRAVCRDYVETHGLQATNGEVREFQAFQEKSMAQARVRRKKRLKELNEKLRDPTLERKERDRSEKHRDTLVRLAEHENRRKDERTPEERAAAFRAIAGPWIEAWKVNRAIYEAYGGVVAITKFGPDPVGAMEGLLRGYAAKGLLVIHDDQLKRRFWTRVAARPRFVAEPEQLDFTPYWKKALPADDE